MFLKTRGNLDHLEEKYQSGCFKKTKHATFSEKQTFLTP